MPARVRAIVLNWNGIADTVLCVESLQRSDYPALDIVIVDNGSAHDEAQRLTETFPTLQVIRNPENRGFAGGCNDGMQSTCYPQPDYYLLLNNDATVASETVQQLVQKMENDKRVGIVGATVFAGNSELLYCQAGGRAHLWRDDFRLIGRGRTSDNLLPAEAVQNTLGYVSGCCMLIRKTVCAEVGYFDERYFAYFEETDLCRRAVGAGWKLGYAPNARAWHRVAASTRYLSATYIYYMLRNKMLFARTALPSWQFVLYFLIVYAPRNIGGYLYLSLRNSGTLQVAAIAGALWDGFRQHYGRRKITVDS